MGIGRLNGVLSENPCEGFVNLEKINYFNQP
jgi:hypothetical protein